MEREILGELSLKLINSETTTKTTENDFEDTSGKKSDYSFSSSSPSRMGRKSSNGVARKKSQQSQQQQQQKAFPKGGQNGPSSSRKKDSRRGGGKEEEDKEDKDEKRRRNEEMQNEASRTIRRTRTMMNRTSCHECACFTIHEHDEHRRPRYLFWSSGTLESGPPGALHSGENQREWACCC